MIAVVVSSNDCDVGIAIQNNAASHNVTVLSEQTLIVQVETAAEIAVQVASALSGIAVTVLGETAQAVFVSEPAGIAVVVSGVSESGSSAEYFETVSKNLKTWNATFAYDSGALDTITYTDGVSSIVKTFNYTLSQLTSIVLSGDTPSGINLTKTFTYSGSSLTGVSYS